MKRLLLYGDSNVWGDNFDGPRIPYASRWSTRLRRSLKNEYIVLVDGVPGRVAGDYRSDKKEKNGRSGFEKYYSSIKEFDVIIVALGTNDLQERFSQSPSDIIENLLWYKTVSGSEKVFYLLPPHFDTTKKSGPEFTNNSELKRKELIASRHLLEHSILIEDVELSDGIHFTPVGHKNVASAVLEYLKGKI